MALSIKRCHQASHVTVTHCTFSLFLQLSQSVSPVVAFRYGACVSALRLRKEEFRKNHFATLFETCTHPLLLSGGVFRVVSAQHNYFDKR